MDNNQKLQLMKELKRREKLAEYKDNFVRFAEEQIKILPKDSAQGFIPFELNEAQIIVNNLIEKQLAETGKVRAIVLKGRQMGLSTYTTCRVYWKAYFNPYHKSVVMAHDSATSDSLFTMSRNIISYMSDDFRPEFKKSNAKEIQFEHNDSGYRLYTAGSPEAGRGTTPTVCHLSEVAFWTHDEKILAGMFQGISQAAGTEVILESTANGIGNEFHRLWVGAVNGENEYLPIFVPWYLMTEYRTKAPEGFLLDALEQEYATKYKLDNDQMYWRRLKIAEGGELKFRQEYPANADEAFIVSGRNVFDLDKLGRYIPEAVLSTKEFNPVSRMFDDKHKGHLEIFQYPKFDTPYVIGADPSMGVGQDYSGAVVLNANREIVATFRDNYIDPANFGELLFYLGRYYNNALLAVESNSMGMATLMRLKQMEYVNLYHQTKIANIDKAEGDRLGWRTTVSSKAAIIGNLKNAVENFEVKIPSTKVLHELMMYSADDAGKTNAVKGEHDDLLMAFAIGLEVIRTHGDKLSLHNISWKQKFSAWNRAPDTTWI